MGFDEKWFGITMMVIFSALFMAMGAERVANAFRSPEAVCAEQEKMTPFCERLLAK